MAGAIVSRGIICDVASITGTGADLVLDVGFIPAFIYAQNITVPTTQAWWNNGMSSALTLSSATVFGIVSTPSGTSGAIAAGAGGYTALDGSAGTGIGVNIGTNTTINTSGEVWSYTCFRPV